MWRLRPGVMALGMLPALIVSVVFMAALLTLAWFSDELAAAITPFADDWAEAWQRLVRIFVSGGLLFAAAAIAAYSFTAVTLIVGDPFYERVWKAAEEELGGFQEVKLGFWRSAGDAIKLLLRSIGAAILVSLVGLIPLLGQILGPVLGAILAGHILARELTNRPLEARGIASADRKALLKGNRARELGFGVMTQLFYLVPGGAALIMPAAAVGATDLARIMLASSTATSADGEQAAPQPQPADAPHDPSGRPNSV